MDKEVVILAFGCDHKDLSEIQEMVNLIKKHYSIIDVQVIPEKKFAKDVANEMLTKLRRHNGGQLI